LYYFWPSALFGSIRLRIILKSEILFDIIKMSAILKSFLVRRSISKPGVPYNRRLRARGSSHPFDYDADLSLPAEESNAFRIQSPLPAHPVTDLTAID
jgi:hypothetical protein